MQKYFFIFFCMSVMYAENMSCCLDAKIDFVRGYGLSLLRSDSKADRFNYVQLRVDFFGHFLQDIFCLRYDVRSRSIVGDAGYLAASEYQRVYSGFSETDHRYRYKTNLIPIWLKEFSVKHAVENFSFEIGLLPYSLGNGLVVGDAHVVKSPFTGTFVYENIDQFRPGAKLQCDITDWLRFLAYMGMIKTNGHDFTSLVSLSQAQSLESDQDNKQSFFSHAIGALSTEVQFSYKNCTFLFSPFTVISKNSSEKVEFFDDAYSSCVTPGFDFWFNSSCWTLSFHYAHNIGKQTVKAWDRNQFYNTGNMYNTHLFYVDTSNNQNQGVTVQNAQPENFSPYGERLTPNDYPRQFKNGEIFEYQNTIFMNSFDRFRKHYQNDLRGFFTGVFASYTYAENSFLTSSIGYFSGDNPPNETEDDINILVLTPGKSHKDIDKTYKGFVGIETMFNHPRMTSYFIHDARKVYSYYVQTDEVYNHELTNLFYWGLSCKHSFLKNDILFAFDANFFYFYQPRSAIRGYTYSIADSFKINYTQALEEVAQRQLKGSLGTEFNCRLQASYHDTFFFNFALALFRPGNYYNLAQGAFLPVVYQEIVVSADSTGIEDEPSKYDRFRLGLDTAVMVEFSCWYCFDFI